MAYTFWQSASSQTAEPRRVMVHKTRVVAYQGTPREALDAAGDRLIVAAGDGAVVIRELQIPSKKPLSAAEFLRGHRLKPREIMGVLSP